MQIPCAGTPVSNITNKYNVSKLKAVSKNSAIWKQGQKGNITITFGTSLCDGCGTGAAWSNIGSESNEKTPSMNLGFVDPPYGSFEYKGIKYDVPISEERNNCISLRMDCNETDNRDGCIRAKKRCENSPSPNNCSCAPGWVPGATVVHEFGHALGMMHEHQNNLNNKNPIKLNINNVIKYYLKNDMTEEDAFVNVLDYYKDNTGYSGTDFDPDSIMLYSFSDNWVIGNNPTKANFKLSSRDIKWLQELYPLNSKNPPEITVSFIDVGVEQWKKAWVEKVVLETYEPIIGIKWNFISGLAKSPDNYPVKPKVPSSKTSVESNEDIDTSNRKCVSSGNTGFLSRIFRKDESNNSEDGDKGNSEKCHNDGLTNAQFIAAVIGVVLGGILLLYLLKLLIVKFF